MTIVVTAPHYIGGYYAGEYLTVSIPTINFGVFSLPSGIDGGALSPSDTIVIAAKDGRPETRIDGAEAAEVAAVMAALANASNNAKLTTAFAEMTSKNVKLKVTVVDTAPEGFHPGATAEVTIRATQSPDGRQHFVPNAEVEIVIVASRLNDPSWGSRTFEQVLAHELMHLFRNASGKFVQEPPGTDDFPDFDEVYDDLYQNFSAANYIGSSVVEFSVQLPSEPSVFVPIYANGIGTNGNNIIKIPDNPTAGEGQFWMTSDVFAGSGNDIIIGGTGVLGSSVNITTSGLKLIYNAAGFFNIIMSDVTSTSGMTLSRIGDDLYIDFDGGNDPATIENGIFFSDFYSGEVLYAAIHTGSEVLTLESIGVSNINGMNSYHAGPENNIGWTDESLYQHALMQHSQDLIFI